jgi:FAD binding domain
MVNPFQILSMLIILYLCKECEAFKLRHRVWTALHMTDTAKLTSDILSELPKARIRKFTLQGPDTVPHAVIAGGGPAGLLAAMMLLSRGYKVTLHEAREDPKVQSVGSRAFSLGLNCRGQKALKYFSTRAPGLLNAIQNYGLGIDAFFIHIGNKELRIRKPIPPNTYTSVTTWDEMPPPTLMIPRNRLCQAMLEVLEYHYASQNKFSIKFSSKLQSVDLKNKLANFSSYQPAYGYGDNNGNTSIAYDILLGADGVTSALRGAMNSEPSFVSEEVVLPGIIFFTRVRRVRAFQTKLKITIHQVSTLFWSRATSRTAFYKKAQFMRWKTRKQTSDYLSYHLRWFNHPPFISYPFDLIYLANNLFLDLFLFDFNFTGNLYTCKLEERAKTQVSLEYHGCERRYTVRSF